MVLAALTACGGSLSSGPAGARAATLVEPVDITAAWDAQSPGPRLYDGALVSLKAGTTELPIVELRAEAVVEVPRASTTLQIVFEAPADFAHALDPEEPLPLIRRNVRRREPGRLQAGGLEALPPPRFDLRLPQGGAVQRFASKTPDGWQEADLVQAAHVDGGGLDRHPIDVTPETPTESAHFVVSVDPMALGARRTFVVTYTEPLPFPGQPYRLPLLGLEWLPTIEAVVRFPLAPGQTAVRIHKHSWMADRDWIVEWPSTSPTAVRWLTSPIPSREGLAAVR